MNDANSIYLSLAPTDLDNARPQRYDGSGFSVSLNDLANEDIALIIRVYQALKNVYDLWLYMRDAPNFQILHERIEPFMNRDFLSAAQAIGSSTYMTEMPNPMVRKVIHDIRGGGLTALIGYAQLLSRLERDDDIVRKAVFLARDHAKMMRNALPDLDIPFREADESNKLHHIREFVDKWDQFVFDINQKKVQIRACSDFDGYITNRCLETSAVDRILYNYINNAARFAAANEVFLTVIPVHEGLTRWVVENALTQDQVDWLSQNLNNDLQRLFYGGVTRGGHGIGLSSCTDFVASSFGLTNDKAVQKQYLGAKVQNQTFYAWFHWPTYVPEAHDVECEC